MVLDPGGVPLRVRSHLARLRPEHKERLAGLRDAFGGDDPCRRFRHDVGEWLCDVARVAARDQRSRTLLAGWDHVPAGFHGSTVRLDPRGRGTSLGFIGPFESELVGLGTFDLVVVVLGPSADNQPWSSLIEAVGAGAVDPDALDAAVAAVDLGGRLAIAASHDRGDALRSWCNGRDRQWADAGTVAHGPDDEAGFVALQITRASAR